MTLHDEVNPIGSGACGCDECERERAIELHDYEKMLGTANKRILGLEADVDYQIEKHKKARDELNRFVDIIAERSRQDAKWGEQNHDPFTWLAILTEEIGEMTHEALVMRFGLLTELSDIPRRSVVNYRKELVQVAAVAVAMLESFDRGKWRWPE